ncbi:MAG: amino acid ABC transporter permease [Bulleidia sp.]
MVLTKLFADIAKIWAKYSGSYLSGVKNTILLAFIGTVLGCVIGFICGILQTIPVNKKDNPVKKGLIYLIRGIIRAYVEIFRGTPMVLQAVFFYYGLSYMTNGALNFSNPWVCSIFVVSINTGAYMAETVRGGILSIDRGQTEGAKAIGMSHVQTMLYVILPQTLRNILPQIGNNYIINIKDTSVMFMISFTELFAVHKSVTGATYQYFPSAVIEMIAYLTLTLASSFLLRLWEKKLAGKSSYELATADQLSPTSGTLNAPHKGSNYDEQHIETRGGEK